eukprot:6197077-Pleurochrysis_carterae.AAC.2
MSRALDSLSVDEVVLLLHPIGLQKYEGIFREHSINGNSGLELADEDLVEIGVTSKYHRKRLLNGFAKYRENGVSHLAAYKDPKLRRCVSDHKQAASERGAGWTALMTA